MGRGKVVKHAGAAQQPLSLPPSPASSGSLLCLGPRQPQIPLQGYSGSQGWAGAAWILPRLCQRGARIADSASFASSQHPKKLFKLSLPSLAVTYLIIAHGARSLARPPTFTPSPTAPRHLREELKQPQSPSRASPVLRAAGLHSQPLGKW